MSVWPHSPTCTPDCPGHVREAKHKPVSIRWCEQHRSTADPREGDCHWTQYQLTLPGDRAPALCVISTRQLAEGEA